MQKEDEQNHTFDPNAAPYEAGGNHVGTRLVHYGPTSDETLGPSAADVAGGPTAVLVCHGMGEQVRYETISSIAQAIRTEALAAGAVVEPIEVHLSREQGEFLARAELTWTDGAREKHQVHVYEAYWAPLTEGRVSYLDTIIFLFEAAWSGFTHSKLFRGSTFDRWMFDGRKTVQVGSRTKADMLCVFAVLLAQVITIAYVLLELAQQYRNVVSQPLPCPGSGCLGNLLKWISPFFPGYNVLLHPGNLEKSWWLALGYLIFWILLIAEALAARYFIVEYVGDVAAYISPYKDSKFDDIRHQIQDVGLNVGKVIYGFGSPQPNVPFYQKIVIVGHSLGSVLAYDTLNALINLDNVSVPPDQRNVVGRTRALITLGSPLDKTAFIFRMQAKNDQDWIREQLAASVQPLIVSYSLYRPRGFDWVNIWAKMDIISGELNYYDDPAAAPNVPPCVQNMPDPQAKTPLIAHVQYFGHDVLRQQLFRFVC
jgi:pimeloyl-ACP methyl ester carboxylesterase